MESTYWIIGGVIFLLIVIVLAKNSSKTRKERLNWFTEKGVQPSDFIFVGTYMTGHPDIDDSPLPMMAMLKVNANLEIFQEIPPKEFDNPLTTPMIDVEHYRIPVYIGKIPISQIKNISLEDASTIEKRLSAMRFLAVGLIAFAFKKKEVNEIAYLVVEWNDGKFEHETVFEFAQKNAVQNANKARNQLIRLIR